MPNDREHVPVTIRLCKCDRDGIHLLVMRDLAGGLHRITGHDPVVSTVVETFHCKIPRKLLRDLMKET